MPPGKSLKVPLEPPAEGGPNQHNPAPPCAAGALQGQRETGRLCWLSQSHCLWVSSHLPPCHSSDVSSEHIHTFQVAQKLPQCHSANGPVPVAGCTGPGGAGTRTAQPSQGGIRRCRVPARPRRSCWSGRIRFCFRRGQPGKRRSSWRPQAPRAVPQLVRPRTPPLRGRSTGLLRCWW